MIVLDTHVWLWWVSAPNMLSAKALRAIEGAETLGVSAMTCWEVSMLVEKNLIDLNRKTEEWIKTALAIPRTRLLPVSPEIAVQAPQLKNFHEDPIDRILVVTAMIHKAPLITKDKKISAHPLVKTIW